MFYSDVILSKRGPLAKVWLAAHAERRLSKVQLLQTDIEQSVSTIIGPNTAPMALRLSGQLLLGVVRIYSRKAKYLLDDCNDALLKLKTAFRSGAIDFTTDLAHGSHHNVTLPVTRAAYDLSLPDPALEGWDAESSIGGDSGRVSATYSNRYTARPADITLRRYLDPNHSHSSFGWASGDFFDPDGGNAEADVPQAQPVQRRDSQGRLVDENGDPIDEDDLSSIGIGRDAPSQHAGGARPSLTAGDLTGFDDFGGPGFLMPEEGGDTGLDLGLEEFDAQRRSSTPTRHTGSLMEDMSPRTALKVQQAAEKRAAAAQKARKQIIDSRTQLDDSRRRTMAGTQGIVLAEQTFLPPSRAHLHLLELWADPGKGLLPFAPADATGRQTLSAARFLAPQLSELFTVDASLLMRRHRSPCDDEGPAQKRLRASVEREEEEFGSEIGRRAAATSQLDLGLGGQTTFDDFEGFDPFAPEEVGFDVAAIAAETSAEQAGPRRSQRKRQTGHDLDEEEERRRRAFHEPGELQRLSTPSEGSVAVAADTDLSPTSSYPLRAFDTSAAGEVAGGAGTPASSSMAINRNTTRAIKVLRTHLSAADEQAELHFSDVTRNASRRAAAAFFFEALALGTKDCLRIEQEESFGDITIQAKPTFWTMERASSVRA